MILVRSAMTEFRARTPRFLVKSLLSRVGEHEGAEQCAECEEAHRNCLEWRTVGSHGNRCYLRLIRDAVAMARGACVR